MMQLGVRLGLHFKVLPAELFEFSWHCCANQSPSIVTVILAKSAFATETYSAQGTDIIYATETHTPLFVFGQHKLRGAGGLPIPATLWNVDKSWTSTWLTQGRSGEESGEGKGKVSVTVRDKLEEAVMMRWSRGRPAGFI